MGNRKIYFKEKDMFFPVSIRTLLDPFYCYLVKPERKQIHPANVVPIY